MAISPRRWHRSRRLGYRGAAAPGVAWRSEFFTRDRLRSVVPRVRWNGALLAKSLLVALAMVLLFFLGQPPAKVAIVGGALLLVTRRIRPERVYREIDWSLLLLFAGLFIVIAGMEAALGPEALLRPPAQSRIATGDGRPWPPCSRTSSATCRRCWCRSLSCKASPRHIAWLTLAMAATLAGNFTILGSIANIIAVQRARQHGHRHRFLALSQSLARR